MIDPRGPHSSESSSSTGDNGARRRLKVFISYSRRDGEFADKLAAHLASRSIDVIIDRQDLPKLADWERELVRLIRASDSVIFIVSSHSVSSKVCQWELDQVKLLSKRLAPIVLSEAISLRIPEDISKLNYIDFTSTGRFDDSCAILINALTTDIEWLKEHTRLSNIALRWDERGHPTDALLRGGDLDEADGWAAKRPLNAPIVTDVVRKFITASRLYQRQLEEREEQRLAQVRRFQKRASFALAGVAAIVCVASVLAFSQSRSASLKESLVLSRLAQDAMDYKMYDRAMRLAILGTPPPGSLPTFPWSRQLEMKLRGAMLLNQLETRFGGHRDVVVSASLDPRDALAATASRDGTVQLLDATTGDRHQQFVLGDTKVSRAVFSPDGSKLAVATEAGKTKVWATQGGNLLAEIPKGSAHSISFYPDGKRILIPDSNQTLWVWDLDLSAFAARIQGHPQILIGRPDKWLADQTLNADISANGKFVLTSASGDITARVWDADSGLAVGTLTGHDKGLTAAKFNAQASLILTASHDGTVGIWTWPEQSLIGRLKAQKPVATAAFKDDSKIIATGTTDGIVAIWNVETSASIHTLKGHDGPVTWVGFTKNNQLVSAGSDGSVIIWSAETGEEEYRLRGHEGPITSAGLSSSGRSLITSSEDGTARLWALLPTMHRSVLHQAKKTPLSIAFSPDGNSLLAAFADGETRLLDPKTGRSTFRASTFPGFPLGGGYLSDGRAINYIGWDTALRVYNIRDRGLDSQLGYHVKRVSAFAVESRMDFAMTGGYDGVTRLFELGSGKLLVELKGHSDTITSVAIHPSTMTAATGSKDKTIRMWDLNKRSLRFVLKGHLDEITSVAFDPTGNNLISTSNDKTARIWDLRSDTHSSKVLLHESPASKASPSSDGETIATASADGTVYLWDLITGAQIAKIHATGGKAVDLQFSPDGKSFAVASEDGGIGVWTLPVEYFLGQRELRVMVCQTKLRGEQRASVIERADSVVSSIDAEDRGCGGAGPLATRFWSSMIKSAESAMWTVRPVAGSSSEHDGTVSEKANSLNEPVKIATDPGKASDLLELANDLIRKRKLNEAGNAIDKAAEYGASASAISNARSRLAEASNALPPGALNAGGEQSPVSDCASCPQLVAIPPGRFTMGSYEFDSEGPPHIVTITNGLFVGRHEVTIDQWRFCVEERGCPEIETGKGSRGNLPMTGVSWVDAIQYSSWLSKHTGKKYRLLSESEWEYIARAGATTRYPWGNDVGFNNANCNGCGGPIASRKEVSPVGSFSPNQFGVFDMNGNAYEWVLDRTHKNYFGAPSDGSAWEQAVQGARVMRGGSWADIPQNIRSSSRGVAPETTKDKIIGFRVIRE